MSPSKESEALKNKFSSIAAAMTNPFFQDATNLRILWEEASSLAAEPSDVTYLEVQCPGTVRPALWCYPVQAPRDAAILYFHGGGFMTGSPSSHRKLAGHLAKAAGVPCLIPDYRKAPENMYPCALEDGVKTYHWLIEQGIGPRRIATAGDSAGGNLATTVVLKAREEGMQTPAAVVAFSPWYDMALEGKTIESNQETDVMVNTDSMKMMIDMYFGTGTSKKDPLFNPIYADLKGFPPVFLSCGTHEGLQDNATMFAETARKQGVEVSLEEKEGMQHVHCFMAGRAPEADETLAKAGRFVREKLGF